MKKEILRTLELEGGYVDDPNDNGGETKFGISKKRYPDVNIRDLTIEHAHDLALRDFWTPLRLDEILSVHVRWKVFDIGFNAGPERAVKMLQRVLSVPDDGIIGPKTIAQVNTWTTNGVGEHHVLFKLVKEQCKRYAAICKNDPSQLKFLLGWLERAFDVGEKL